MPVIYRIKNKKNDKVLIACAKTAKRTFLEHRKLLRCGGHPNAGLQRDWNDYGESAFEFDVVENIAAGVDSAAREQYHMEQHDALSKGYNQAPVRRRGRKPKEGGRLISCTVRVSSDCLKEIDAIAASLKNDVLFAAFGEVNRNMVFRLVVAIGLEKLKNGSVNLRD